MEEKILLDQALSESAYAFVTKPIDMDALLRLLDTIAQAHTSGNGRQPRSEAL